MLLKMVLKIVSIFIPVLEKALMAFLQCFDLIGFRTQQTSHGNHGNCIPLHHGILQSNSMPLEIIDMGIRFPS